MQAQNVKSDLSQNFPPKPAGISAWLIVFLLVLTSLTLGAFLGVAYLAPMIYEKQTSVVVVPQKITATPTIALPRAKMANWKTYKNEKLSVELKYPSNWSISPGSEAILEGKWSQFNLFDLKSPDIIGEIILQEGAELIFAVVQPTNETLDQFVKNIILQNQKAGGESSLTENFDFYGLKAYLITNSGKTTDGKVDISKEVYFEKNNLFYGFAYVINGKNKENNLNTIDQILSTFKFTGEMPTVTKNPEGEFCGGFAGVACPDGYTCKLEGSFPDAGGRCEKQ